MTLPATKAIDIYIGDDFLYKFRLKTSLTGPYVNVTGWTGRAQLRNTLGALIASFAVAVDADQVVNTGLINVTMGKAVTALLAPGTLFYDIEMTKADLKVQTFLAGTANIIADVTKD